MGRRLFVRQRNTGMLRVSSAPLWCNHPLPILLSGSRPQNLSGPLIDPSQGAREGRSKTGMRRGNLMKLALVTIVTANLEQMRVFYQAVLQIEPQIYRGNYVAFALEAGTLALWRQSECEEFGLQSKCDIVTTVDLRLDLQHRLIE